MSKRKQTVEQALEALQGLIEAGTEFPDASAHVAVSSGVPIDELRAAYDDACASEYLWERDWEDMTK